MVNSSNICIVCEFIYILFQHTITKNVINGVYKGVTTVELDMLAAETAASLATEHPDYAVLAARIVVSNLHKETKKVSLHGAELTSEYFCEKF